ncbi:MAG: hypothetical protein GQE15_17180 [Archangiaceae bacterium]|nr:hypothetical protein [Archangiaceae bacterium]
MQLIDTAQLKRAQVPGRSATWAQLEAFALTFDGYARFGNRLGDLTAEHRRSGTVPSTPDELRGCLFFVQRVLRHQMSRPNERDLAFIHALLDGLRATLPE